MHETASAHWDAVRYFRDRMRGLAAARLRETALSDKSRSKQFGAAHGSANCKRRSLPEAEREAGAEL